MTIETIFPSVILTDTELDILREVFTIPVTKKYLRSLAAESMKELAAISTTSGIQAEGLVNAHSRVYGELSILSTLLEIGNNQPKEH